MDFIELRVKASTDLTDMLIAELGEVGFDTFMETPDGFNAYTETDLYRENEVGAVIEKYAAVGPIEFSTVVVPKENWNESWESNYHPIEIPGKCRVRASFHQPDDSYPLEVVINPKMSFGTGHHATTYLMMDFLLEKSWNGKAVVDLGTGTGILAIVAHKLGATIVDATDVDDWCIENSRENFDLNGCGQIQTQLGAVQQVQLRDSYDLVIANINRNVLLEEIPAYAELLMPNGTLLLSGFYEDDLAVIKTKAAESGLSCVEHRVKDAWTAALFLKKG